jgi:hypothetical protein
MLKDKIKKKSIIQNDLKKIEVKKMRTSFQNKK